VGVPGRRLADRFRLEASNRVQPLSQVVALSSHPSTNFRFSLPPGWRAKGKRTVSPLPALSVRRPPRLSNRRWVASYVLKLQGAAGEGIPAPATGTRAA